MYAKRSAAEIQRCRHKSNSTTASKSGTFRRQALENLNDSEIYLLPAMLSGGIVASVNCIV